jgi:hypothetical protein
MTLELFRQNLFAASVAAIDFGGRYIYNSISNNITYDIEFNCSCDQGLTQFDRYENDEGRVERNVSVAAVLRLLYRKGKVPAWIDVSIVKSNRFNTRLGLKCAGRYTDQLNDLYYVDQGTHPFGIKSPILPPWLNDGENFIFYTGNPFCHELFIA